MVEYEEGQYSFGTWVRRRRKALDLTQAALAQRVGCAEVTIRKIEADAFRPSREIAERLANCLDIPSDERALFIQVARAERTVDHLAAPLASIALGASEPALAPFSPAPAMPVQFQHEAVGASKRDELVVAKHSPMLDRNCQALLTKVKTTWISGDLNHSADRQVFIHLDLTRCSSVVHRPYDLLVQRPKADELPFRAGTTITEVFDQACGEVLILGEPGSGKTSLLLELLRDLLDRAQRDSTHPIPVVFPLSTWSTLKLPLNEWMMYELFNRYGVPIKLARSWLDTARILPLLDGLDEVGPDHQQACVEAINYYHQKHGLQSLVVCSRTADYMRLTVKLQLHDAVRVQPLSDMQIDGYLTRFGSSAETVQTAIQADPTLRSLLDTPLMLHIVTLTYADQSSLALQTLGSPAERRSQVFAAYLQRMFERGPAKHLYTPAQTMHWLKWLAWQMRQHDQTLFFIERMQPELLPRRERRLPTIGVGLLLGLVAGLILGVGTRLTYGLIESLLIGFASSLIIGLRAGYAPEITSVEVVRCSWTKSQPEDLCRLSSGLIYGSIGGVLGGITSGLWVGLGVGLGTGLVYGLIDRLAHGEIETKTVPNQGIRYSIRNGLIFGLIGSVIIGLASGLGGLSGGVASSLDGYLYGGFAGGMFFGLMNGGRAVLQHFVLRALLVRNGFAPWRYVAFLDFAAQRILLRKVGGGYIFIHRLLQDYLAEQYAQDLVQAARQTRATSFTRRTHRAGYAIARWPLPVSLRKKLVSSD